MKGDWVIDSPEMITTALRARTRTWSSRVVMMIGFLSVAWVGVLAGPVEVEDTRALIEQALAEPARISLDNIALGEAIRVVTEQTGVKIVMPPEVMNLVPQGAATLVRQVEIANMPLREALAELFSPLGMKCQVRDTYVEIVPKESLRRLSQPPTWVELAALSALEALEPGTDPQARTTLASRLQFQVPVRNAWERLSQALGHVGAGPGDEVLTIACRNLGWAWALSGERIVITAMEQQVRRRLRRPISLRRNNRPLFDIMQAIGGKAGVSIRAEPGALAALPLAVQRNFSLNVQRQPAEQVLDSIAAYTGLGYVVTPEGVLFFRADDSAGSSSPSVQPSVPGPSGDPYVAKMTIRLEDGTNAEWLIRRSELPEDLRLLRKRDLAELFEAVRRGAAERAP